MEKSCTEIMQHFWFSFRILHSRNWKFGFLFVTYLHPWETILKVKGMTCLWVDSISLTENAHMIMHKYVRYLVNKFTHNTYLVVSTFIWRGMRLYNLTNWNHPTYLWHDFVIIYLMKMIRVLALLWHILILFFNLFLQKKW